MSKYIKSNFKSLLCVILAFSMIFSFFTPLSKILVSADDSPAKMLYFKTTETNASDRRLYQRAAVEVGKTYYFSFWISKDVSFTPICRADGNRPNINANIELVERVEKGECAFYTYSYTMPENSNVTELVFFGLQFTSVCEGYFFDASVKLKDSETELFANSDFSTGLYDWAWNFKVWFRGDKAELTEWNDSAVTLKVMDFDKNLIAEEEEAPDKMLHINYSSYSTTDNQNELYQLAPVTKNETYYFTFSLSNSISDFDMVCRANSDRSGISANAQQVSKDPKDGYTVYTYSFTIPETYKKYGSTVTDMTDMVFFGIKFKEAVEGYFFNATVYNANDAEKTELLTNPDFSSGVLDEWAVGWKAWFKASKDGAGLSKWNNDVVSIEVVDYDESLFGDNDGDDSSSSSGSSDSSDSSDSSNPDSSTGNKMLYVNYKSNANTENENELYQLAPVTKNETYYFTFSLSNSISDFDMVCRANSDRSGISANAQQVSKEPKDGYTVYTYSFTIPETYKKYGSTVTDMTPLVFFGIKFKASEGYFFNASLYHSEDENKTELFTNPDFSSGVLDQWAVGWRAWFKENQNPGIGLAQWNNDNVSIEVVDYDESLFGDNDDDDSSSSSGSSDSSDSSDTSDSSNPDVSGGKKMLYIKGSASHEFYQRAPVTVGETYHFSFSVTDSLAGFTLVCRADENRPGVNANITLVDMKDEYGYKTYTYSYTIPETALGGTAMTESVFFGVKFPANSEGYFFNTSLYHSEDDNKTELLTNPDFSTGFNKWALGWDKWFGESDSALTEWTNDAGTATLKIVDYDESLFEEITIPDEPDEPVSDKMLHINTTAGKELYQRAVVEVGKTYYFTFSVSDTITKFTPACNADDKRAAIDANITLVDTKDEYGYKTYTYSYTIPETDSKGNAMSDSVFFGIKLTGTNEGYFFNASVKLKDSETELLANPDFKVGLDEWAWGWDAWFRGDKLGLTKWNNDKTTLEIVNLDKSLFEEINKPVYSKKMLYINTTSGKDLMQRIPVEIGETYHFTFSLSNSIDFFTAICLADDKRPNVDANIELIEKIDRNGYTVYTYSYTIPEKDSGGNDMTDIAFFGIKLSGTQEGYLFDTSVYKANDKNKTELLDNPDFKIGLDEWAWGWDAWFRGDKAGLEEWANDKTKLQLVGYDESLFGGDEDVTPKMLYIKTTSPKELMQRAQVKAGETYYFTFSLTDTITSFQMLCRSDSQRNVVEADIQFVDEIDKDGYTAYTYSYTIPETYINSDGEEVPVTDNIFFGIKPSVSCEGYMFDVSVYKANEKFKTELFENSDFQVGLDRWTWGWDVWFAHSAVGPAGLYEWSNDSTTLKVVDFSKVSINEVNSKIPGKQMVYFINGATSSHFAARVELELGVEYYMQFSAFSTDEIDIKLSEDGGREAIRDINKELISAEEHGNYTTYLYKFIMPEGLENNLVFAGPVIKYYSEGFIFDLSLYKADDDKKTNLWANPEFKAGLDGWIWNWHAWFGYNTDSGTKNWTNGANTVQLMDFDLSKIDELIALLNVNDGEWWNPEDLIDESALGTASLIGTLVDQKNNPIPDIKLILESNDNSYTAVTDSKGAFEFKDFNEGFYELYAVDSNGNKVSTGFYTNFSDGDIVTLKLVSDSSNVSEDSSIEIKDDNEADNSDSEDGEPDTESEKASVGTIFGTVYTAELKTVADLKIYIRGVGEAVTDENGHFEFIDIPIGDYEIYTVLADGSEYIFRTVSVKENIELTVKLKYAPETDASAKPDGGFNWLWVIIPAVAAVLVAAGVVAVIVLKKKKTTKANK